LGRAKFFPWEKDLPRDTGKGVGARSPPRPERGMGKTNVFCLRLKEGPGGGGVNKSM